MKRGKWGKATGPPGLGRAIIGATLLLKGESFTPSDLPKRDSPEPETAPGTRIRLELPVTQFGQPKPPQAHGRASSRSTSRGLPVQPPYAYAPPPELPAFRPPAARPPSAASFAEPDQRVATARQNQPGLAALPQPPAKPPFDAAQEILAAPPPETTPAPKIAETAPAPDNLAVSGSAGTGQDGAARSPPPALPVPDFGPVAAVPAGSSQAATQPPIAPIAAAPTAGQVAAERLAAPPLSGPQATPQQALAEQPAASGPELAAKDAMAGMPADGHVAQAEPPPHPVAVLPDAPPDTAASRPAAAQLPGDFEARPAPPPRQLSDSELAATHAPVTADEALTAGEDLAAGHAALPEAAAGLVTAGSAELPTPAFGASVVEVLKRPARLAVADIPREAERLPQPEFGPPVAAPAAEAPREMTAPRSAALPQVKFPPAVRSLSAPPPLANSAGYTDTSPSVTGGPAPRLSSDDELILQLQTQSGDMADTIIAYGTRSGVYLPLGAVTRFLDIPIVVSDAGHYASGWFIDESQTLSLNLREGTLVVSGRNIPFGKADAAAFEGELYLRAERFADLFPLTLAVDLRAQTVAVKTRVPFPFEQRRIRDEERARLAGRNSREQKQWPREATPWRALSFPLIDAELRAVTDRTIGTRAEGDIRLAGDFAFMTARAFAQGSSRDGLIGARIELGRRDPDARLLGPLRASEFQLGDVTTVGLPLGLRSTSGRGAFITNAPLERASVFDTIDLLGDLPDGFEVELYRNNILIGSTRSPVNGQYRFLKVATEYGLNVFRLVFYGPQGQRREEVRRIIVGDGRLGKGEFVYAFGAAQKDINVFDVRHPNFSPGLDYGAWRGSALLEYGLSREITASLGGAWFESRFGKRWMATAGLRTGIAATALKLDLGYQSSGGKAIEIGLGGKLLGLGYTLTHAEYHGGFTDELRSFTADPLRRATELSVSHSINLGSEERPVLLPVYGELRRIEFADGRKQTDAALRMSLPLGGLLLSNALAYAGTSNPQSRSTSQLRGTFDLATVSGSRLHVRAGVDYAILPGLRVEGAKAELDYAVDDRTLLRASAVHTFSDAQTNFSLSAIRRFGKFSLAFDGNLGIPDGDYGASLRLGFSFGRNPLNGRLFVAEPGLSAGGAIAARAFRDSNGNRAFDTGEEALPDVEFQAGSGRGKTDPRGIALIGGLGDGSRASLTADRASLPDISLAPVSEGIEVVPRAGRIHVTNYALQELSDIEGTAYFSDGGNLGREVSGLQLQLINAQGEQVARARTEGDGTFYFEQVQPGAYAIRLDPNQAASLKIHQAEAINVTIGPKTAWLKQVVKVSAD